MSPPPDPPADSPEQNTSPLPPAPATASKTRARAFLSRRVIALAALAALLLAAAGWRIRITRPDYRFARGQAAVADRDWKAAGEYADRLAGAGHDNLAHLLRAEAFFARQQHNQVIAECNEIRDEGPVRLRAVVLVGKSQLELGELAEADAAFRYAIDLDPDNADAHRGRAAIAYEMGHFPIARAHLEQIVRLDPDDARPHRVLAEMARGTGKTPEAITEYQHALRIGTGLSAMAREEVRSELCELLAIAYRFDELLELVDAAGPGDRDRPPIVGYRIEALRGLHRTAEAKLLADRALEAPPDATVYRLRGQLYLEDGDARSAVPLLERAAALLPHYYHTQFLLGQAYAAAGRPDDAERATARANELKRNAELSLDLAAEAMAKPWDAEVRLRLAELAEKSGDMNSAAQWRRAAAQCQAARKR